MSFNIVKFYYTDMNSMKVLKGESYSFIAFWVFNANHFFLQRARNTASTRGFT